MLKFTFVRSASSSAQWLAPKRIESPKSLAASPGMTVSRVDDAKTLAGRFVEQDVVQLGVVVGDAQRQLARCQQIHHNVILCFAGADKLNFTLHLCGTTPCGPQPRRAGSQRSAWACRGSAGLSHAGYEPDSRQADAGSCQMQRRSGKILGGLHLLQADGILHKVIDTPAAAIGSLVIRPSLFGRHHMERGTRGSAPRCLAFSRRKSVTPQMFSIRPAGSLNVLVLIFCRI